MSNCSTARPVQFMKVYRRNRGQRSLTRAFCGLAFVSALLVGACSAQPHADSGAGTSQVATPFADGIDSGSPSSGDPLGRTLQLSATTVTPGEIITRTISGANNDSDVTSAALLLEKFENGSWRTLYYLYLGYNQQSPTDAKTGPNVAIPAVGLGPTALDVLIPDVPPGTYRVRQDMSRDDTASSSVLMTLYATIQVVSP